MFYSRRFVILRHDVPDDAIGRVAAARDAGRPPGSSTARDSSTGRDSEPSRDGGGASSVVPGSFLSASHWDWMFEPWGAAAGGGEPLWTWATPIIVLDSADSHVASSSAGEPLTGGHDSPFAAPFESDALRLADHRPAYLDLEGPISGGRGNVTRLLRGKYDWEGPSSGVESRHDIVKPRHDVKRAGSPGHLATLRLTWFDPDRGRERIGRVTLQRNWDDLSDDDSARAVWRLRFSPIR